MNQLSFATPVWRSLLFVPAHIEKFVDNAPRSGADAVILDLEDSVPPSLKGQARDRLYSATGLLQQAGIDVLVRVNSGENADALFELEDLKAGIAAGVKGFVLPKVNSAEMVEMAAGALDDLEERYEKVQEPCIFLAQIEHVDALPNLDSIAASSERLVGMSLGTEDFSVSAGMLPTPDTLYWPSQQIVFACRRGGISPYGFPASIAEFNDKALLLGAIERALEMGFVGAMCIHPSQVSVLNKVMTPSEESFVEAQALLNAWEGARKNGLGAFRFQDKMVDKPVVERAEEVIRRYTQACGSK